MKILALDSSGLVASTAILEENILRGEYTMNYKKTHSQTLLPMIDELFAMTEFSLEEVDAIAVAGGPGSFTGLRIGAATAKGLAMALDKPVISVPTLEGLAYNAYGYNGLICPIMDARRNQVYTGIYGFNGEAFEIYTQQCAVDIQDIIHQLDALEIKKEEPVMFLGDGIFVYRETIEANLNRKCIFAPAHMNAQRGGALGMRAAVLAEEGKLETAAEHKPDYLRLSQAERERNERLASEQQ